MDPRNFAKILLRNIREQFKDVWIGSRNPPELLSFIEDLNACVVLCAGMQHCDMRGNGGISADDLRGVFYRLNIVPPPPSDNLPHSNGRLLTRSTVCW